MSSSEEKRQTEQSPANRTSNARPNPSIPDQLLQAAQAVVSAATAEPHNPRQPEPTPSFDDIPPPPYSAENYGQVDISQNGFNTGAKVAEDGRVDININQVNRRLSTILARQLTKSYEGPPTQEPSIPEGLGSTEGLPCPPLNVVIHVVGSRGDVQPFIALGQVLKNKFNHRVRLATHPVFRDFVLENGLEFFSIGGDPAELMAFMVKNPGLMPGVEALKSGDIGKRRKGIYEIANGCWRSCIEPGDGTGVPASDDVLEGRAIDNAVSLGDASAKPFVADAIIANPPSFAHIHIAEKLGIPLHLMFTMPWSPSQAYPHPLANIVSSNTDAGITNFLSYILVDLLTWQGIGDIINKFREKTLRLEPITIIWAPGSLHRLQIPWTYAWSPALIPKPADWAHFIDIAGFFFLDLATNYTPEPDLAEFLAAGPPPVYIGFGSIVVDDPNAMTKLIFEAVKLTGQRALVSKGWGGLAAGELGQPDDVFMLGNCPHDWLFKQVSAVVHHGGAGTTAAGVKAGRPTVIVPFFGDQPFWGNMVNQAGAGPKPIHHKELTAQKLADAITEALKPESLQKAKELSEKIQNENGASDGADTFHKRLDIPELRCSVCPGRAAVWQVKKTNIKLSALAATVLADQGILDFADLRLFRPREYVVDTGPPEPISGGAAALMGTIGSMTAGVADFPSEVLSQFKSASANNDARTKSRQGSESSTLRTANSAETSTSYLLHASDGSSRPGPTSHSSGMSTPLIVKDGQSTSSLDPDSQRGRSAVAKSESGSSEGHRSAMSTVFSNSPSVTPSGRARSRSQSAARITSDSAIGTAKAAGNIVAVGLKSPLDFTMSLAKGFHNVPRLYNDKTVRPAEKVTGIQSGIKAAGKNFAYGFMDGIGGLVTQPIQGFKEEGGSGLVKGFMKGSFGLVFKPGAAIWGIPAYTMQGLYAEIVKQSGKSTANYIIAARMAQGYEEFRESAAGERESIVLVWRSGNLSKERQQKKPSKPRSAIGGSTAPPATKIAAPTGDRLVDENGQLLSGFRNTMGLSFDERKELERRKQEARRQKPAPQAEQPAPTETDYEEAIQTAVQQTSTNNPEEDRAIENAIRASVQELQRSRTVEDRERTVVDDEEEAYQRAVAASVAEYKRYHNESGGQESGVTSTTRSAHDAIDDDELTRAVMISMQDNTQAQHHEVHDSDDDEDYKRAIAESIKQSANAQLTDPRPAHGQIPALPDRATVPSTQNINDDDNDEELAEALRLSEQESRGQQGHLEQQRTEEEIVLEYVKKQSLMEEELRRKRGEGAA